MITIHFSWIISPTQNSKILQSRMMIMETLIAIQKVRTWTIQMQFSIEGTALVFLKATSNINSTAIQAWILVICKFHRVVIKQDKMMPMVHYLKIKSIWSVDMIDIPHWTIRCGASHIKSRITISIIFRAQNKLRKNRLL